MSKVTLDMTTFKALASDTRLDILRALDGKKMSLKDISSATSLNKATLHEHLIKLNEAGLVKKNEREGHKWVYYKLTWKGECLLHPENTRIVVLFCATFMTLFIGIIQLISYVKGVVIGKVVTIAGSTRIYETVDEGGIFTNRYSIAPGSYYNVTGMGSIDSSSDGVAQTAAEKIGTKGALGNSPMPTELSEISTDSSSWLIIWHDPSVQIIAIACLVVCTILLSAGIWWLFKNKKPKL